MSRCSKNASLAHIICGRKQSWWNGKPQESGGPYVHDELKPRRLQHRQISKFLAFKNTADVKPCASHASAIIVP